MGIEVYIENTVVQLVDFKLLAYGIYDIPG